VTAGRATSDPAPPVRPIAWRGGWRDGVLAVLDQTLLPAREVWNERRRAAEVVEDVRRLAVRGAPVLGIAAAYGMVLAAGEAARGPGDPFLALAEAGRALRGARPTAVNLARAVDRSLARVRPGDLPATGEALFAAARDLEDYETRACLAIGRHGAAWLRGRDRILTHCNAGALVTTGLGTALAPIYVLHHEGRRLHVWVDETRPLLQGLRLTAWELGKAGVPHAAVVDGAAAGLVRRGLVDAVIVGADRVCRNGDVANKVGTYPLALAARAAGVPFVVAAPLTTLDPSTPHGDAVPIEERAADGDLYLLPGTRPAGTPTVAPAFDVTPAPLVSALVTERGVLEAPSEGGLEPWMAAAADVQPFAGDGR
jgi:methylthioribose-1-phosphate isomerase